MTSCNGPYRLLPFYSSCRVVWVNTVMFITGDNRCLLDVTVCFDSHITFCLITDTVFGIVCLVWLGETLTIKPSFNFLSTLVWTPRVSPVLETAVFAPALLRKSFFHSVSTPNQWHLLVDKSCILSSSSKMSALSRAAPVVELLQHYVLQS